MEFTVEELAGRAGVSVDTIRFYQGRRLIPPPERRGRRAVYTAAHVDLLDRIADLKAKGLSLTLIGRVLGESVEDGAAVPGISIDELSAISRVPVSWLERAVAMGLLSAVDDAGGVARFDPADAEAARLAMAVVEAGMPLDELMDLAAMFDEAVGPLAARAVELFLEHVKLQDGTASLRSLGALLDAAAVLSGRSFRRALVREAEKRVEDQT